MPTNQYALKCEAVFMTSSRATASSVQHFLNFVKKLSTDERLVSPIIELAFPIELPTIDGIDQQIMQCTLGDFHLFLRTSPAIYALSTI